MKKLMILFALIMGVVSVKAQSNDLYQGITKKLPYRQMVTPYGVQVTFAKQYISFSRLPLSTWT